MKCPQCSSENSLGQKFCGECGSRLDPGTTPASFASPQSYTPRHLAERILTSRFALEGERKQVTVLFCDITNSTALAERLGGECMHALLSQFFELALAEVHRYEGTINQFLGDGFMALFGAPVAHEDHARRAVLTALDIQHALSNAAAAISGIEVRMGLHTGPVVVGKIGDNLRMDYTAVGDTTNVAARLQQRAEPGAIWISEELTRLVQDYVECKPLGTRNLKGKANPIPVYQVLLAYPTSGGRHRKRLGDTAPPLLGRDREIATIHQAIERLANGRGGILRVIGEAGLGKSRLVEEARRHGQNMELRWVEGNALSFGRTLSYWPFREVIRRLFDIGDEDSEPQSWAKLLAGISPLFPDEAEELLPYIGVLLALPVTGERAERVKYLDGLAMGHQIFRTTLRLVERIARDRPLAVVFEDWHWADASSAELLEHLLPLVGRAPVLFCVVSRPDALGPAAALGEVLAADARLAPCSQELVLAPLGRDDSSQLAHNLLGGGALPTHARDLLLARAAGNPFFLGELIRMLVAIRALEQDEATGDWHATRQFDTIPLPDTLQGVILARIDRLGEDAKQVLKIAAVIGRSFFYRVLRAISEAEAALDDDLSRLQRVELIGEKRRLPELEYIFKHPLIQQATYDSLLEDRRRRLHQQVGACIEELFADRLEEFYSILAYHFGQAEDWAKAQEYLFKAGDQAGSIAADAEALDHYRRALAAYERVSKGRWDPVQRATLDRKMGEAFFRTGQHEQAVEYLESALRHLGEPYPRSPSAVRVALITQLLRQVLYHLLPRPAWLRRQDEEISVQAVEKCRMYEVIGWVHFFTDPERVLLDVLLILRASDRTPRSPEFAIGLAYSGLVFDMIAAYRIASRYHRRADALAEDIQHPLALGHCYHTQTLHHYHAGDWNAALAFAKKAAAAFKTTGHLRFSAGSAGVTGLILCSKGDLGAMLLGEDLCRIGSETKDQQVQAWGWTLVAMCHKQAGALNDALTEFERAIEIYARVPDYRYLACCLAELALCHLKMRNVDQALNLIERSLSMVSEHRITGTSVTRPVMTRVEVYLALAGRTSGSEHAQMLRRAKRAVAAALRQGRLVRDDGAADSLRLAGIYAWVSGDRAKAERLWDESLRLAEHMGAQYVLAQSLLEIGWRLASPSHLARAETVFSEIGAQAELSALRELSTRSA